VKYPFDDYTHGLWALDRVERLALAAYRQFELGTSHEAYGWMDADLDEVTDDILSADPAHTTAILQSFAGLVGAYMHILDHASDEPAEAILASLIRQARPDAT
jgi:hypothetical protein